jgi:hypothetical protein
MAVRRDDPVADQVGTARHVGPDRDVQVLAGDRGFTLVDAPAVGADHLVPCTGDVRTSAACARRGGRQREDAEQAEGQGREDLHHVFTGHN